MKSMFTTKVGMEAIFWGWVGQLSQGQAGRQSPKRTATKRSQPSRGTVEAISNAVLTAKFILTSVGNAAEKPGRFKLLQMANGGAMCQGLPT